MQEELQTPLKQFVKDMVKKGVARYEVDLVSDDSEYHVFNAHGVPVIAIPKSCLESFLLDAGRYGAEVRAVFLGLCTDELRGRRIYWQTRRLNNKTPYALRDHLDA